MKRIISKLIFILIFLTGFSVMMYPTVSNWVNERHSSRISADYDKAVSQMSETDYTEELEFARAYNVYLQKFGDISTAVRAEQDNADSQYEKLLNVGGSRVMATLHIPKIKCDLPIYHTTEESVLQIAVGHYVGSSLPVGGDGTHCVVSGHRGLPSATLFTDLDQMELGDRFYISVLNDTLAYEVDDISIVLPEEVEGLSIRPGEDLVTLVTCTPYGINSHRLLVTGHRIPYDGAMEATNPEIDTKLTHANPAAEDKRPLPVYVYMGAAVLAAGVLGGITRVVSDRRIKKKKRKKAAEAAKNHEEE